MKKVSILGFVTGLVFSGYAVSEEYSFMQAGNFEQLCTLEDPRSEAACISYLTGYRAALQDMRTQSNWAAKTLKERCDKDSKSAACRMQPGNVALEIFEGCDLAGMKISNGKARDMILKYMKGKDEKKKEPFMFVYIDAIGDAIPCPSE